MYVFSLKLLTCDHSLLIKYIDDINNTIKRQPKLRNNGSTKQKQRKLKENKMFNLQILFQKINQCDKSDKKTFIQK